jgi:hypothetical protein
MAIVFQQGSTLLVDSGSAVRRFLISSASISQTYQEERRSVRTIHNKNQIEDTFTNSKGAASVEFTVYLTKEDGILFDWFGLDNSIAYEHTIAPSEEPLPFDLYLISTGAYYKVSNVFPRTLSFDMSKSGPIAINVSATGSDWIEVGSIPTISSQQNPSDFTVSNILGINNLAGISLEFTRDINWRDTKYIQNTIEGEIYTPSKITSSNFSVAGTITKYKKDDILSHTTTGVVDFSYGNLMDVHLEPCKLLDRWQTGSVHRKMTDFMLLPTTTSSYIRFN